MAGVMLAGPSAASPVRRPMPSEPLPREQAPDMSLLVALAVIGLTTIGATAVLMTVIHQPDGWPLVHYVTQPTSGLNLLVQGGLGLAALVLTGRFALAGYRQWRGDASGGRGGALFQAVLAGGFLFAAVELVRAAW
jgi:hypothetical protein